MCNIFIADTFTNLVTFTSWLGCIPFCVDWRRGTLYVYFWSNFRPIHHWSWFASYTVTVLPTRLYILHDTKQFWRFNMTLIIILGCYAESVYLGILAFRTTGMCQQIHGLFKYLPDFQNKYMFEYKFEKEKLQSKLIEIGLMLAYVGAFMLGVFTTLDCY